jgi:hypothetical protein
MVSGAAWQSRRCTQSGQQETPRALLQPLDTYYARTALSVLGPGASSAATRPRQAQARPELLKDAQTFHSRIQALLPGDSAVGFAPIENDGSGCYGPTLLLKTLQVDRNPLVSKRNHCDLS